MKLTVNGEYFEIQNPVTITELLKVLNIDPYRVAVEVNQNIVKKAEFSLFRIKDGDKIEVVNFVGGG